jgi:hypothetical protein
MLAHPDCVVQSESAEMDFDRADRIGEFWEAPGDADLRRAADRPRG